jgi:beta-mannanase
VADAVTCLPAPAGAVPAGADSTALPSIPWGIGYVNDGIDTTGKIVTADIKKTEADDAGVARLVPPLVDVFNNMLEDSADKDDTQFPTAQAEAVVNAGSTPMLTTQWDGNLTDITSGKDNTILTDWAECAKQFAHTVLIRPWRELNGNWYPWGVPNVTAAEYVKAWRDAYNIIHPIAPNVLWVWNVSTGVPPAQKTEAYLNAAYPGDRYVDYISFDSYLGDTEVNGASKPWSDTQATYNNLAALGSGTKPIIVAEFSLKTSDSWLTDSKRATWIKNTFAYAASSKQHRIVSMDWFNGAGPPDATYAFDAAGWPLSQSAFDTAVDGPPYS